MWISESVDVARKFGKDWKRRNIEYSELTYYFGRTLKVKSDKRTTNHFFSLDPIPFKYWNSLLSFVKSSKVVKVTVLYILNSYFPRSIVQPTAFRKSREYVIYYHTWTWTIVTGKTYGTMHDCGTDLARRAFEFKFPVRNHSFLAYWWLILFLKKIILQHLIIN